MATKRQMCRDYSDNSSHSEASEFHPEYHDDYGVTEREYISAYYNAYLKVYKPSDFVEHPKHMGQHPPKMIHAWKLAFHHYLVEIIEWCTEDEFNDKYFVF
jgi:hypothetical protein